MSWKSVDCAKLSSLLLLLLLFAGVLAEPVLAQGWPTDYPRKKVFLTQRRNQINAITAVRPGWTTNQRTVKTDRTTTAPLTPANPHLSSVGFRNNLPPTRLDSFVRNAACHAEHIYGDENAVYDCFTEAHRINTGIVGNRDSGLTTGHGSVMPDAWGRDEFSGNAEWSQSGRRGYELMEQAIKNSHVRTIKQRQFNNGYKELDNQNFYDEDRVRGVDDPYNPYLANQEAAQELADKQVEDAMQRYHAMQQSSGYR